MKKNEIRTTEGLGRIYQSILDTTFKDSVNGFLKYEKSKGNLRLRNLAEKDIEKIKKNITKTLNFHRNQCQKKSR